MKKYKVTRRDISTKEEITLKFEAESKTEAAWKASEELATQGHSFTQLVKVEEILE